MSEPYLTGSELECRELEQLDDGASCRGCGCTEDDGCETEHGRCFWIEEDLCSACACTEGDDA